MIPILSIDPHEDYFEPLRSNRGPWASFDVREECLPKGDYQMRAHLVSMQWFQYLVDHFWGPHSRNYGSFDKGKAFDAFGEHVAPYWSDASAARRWFEHIVLEFGSGKNLRMDKVLWEHDRRNVWIDWVSAGGARRRFFEEWNPEYVPSFPWSWKTNTTVHATLMASEVFIDCAQRFSNWHDLLRDKWLLRGDAAPIHLSSDPGVGKVFMAKVVVAIETRFIVNRDSIAAAPQMLLRFVLKNVVRQEFVIECLFAESSKRNVLIALQLITEEWKTLLFRFRSRLRPFGFNSHRSIVAGLGSRLLEFRFRRHRDLAFIACSWYPSEHYQRAESISYDSLDSEQRIDAFIEHRFVRRNSTRRKIAARQLSTCFTSRGSLSKVHLIAPARRPNANRGDPLPCSNTRTQTIALLAC